MRPIIHFLSGLTVGSLVNTAIVIALDQTFLVPAFVFGSVTLLTITIGIFGIDRRVRRNLIGLAEDVMQMALDKDKALLYHDAVNLIEQIKDGHSLTDSASDIGWLASRVDAAPVIISSEV